MENKVEVWARFHANGRVPYEMHGRIRIIESKGRPSYTTFREVSFVTNQWSTPCWYVAGMDYNQQIKTMKQYDKDRGYITMKIGEL